MSDFDKEAERQKLREKFDRDREKRKETERMSQLLLQGATMTNRHCDTCGDPLFRYQGQQFCATCQGRAQEAEEQANAQPQQTEAEPATTNAQTDADIEATESEAEHTTETDSRASALDADAAGHPAPRVQSEATRNNREQGHEEAQATTAESTNTATPTRTHEARVDSSRGTMEKEDLDAVRTSLIRTLTHHAQQAEEADGPRRATDHLTAVREAAEALAALEESR